MAQSSLRGSPNKFFSYFAFKLCFPIKLSVKLVIWQQGSVKFQSASDMIVYEDHGICEHRGEEAEWCVNRQDSL